VAELVNALQQYAFLEGASSNPAIGAKHYASCELNQRKSRSWTRFGAGYAARKALFRL
jgi:hypothetical protein